MSPVLKLVTLCWAIVFTERLLFWLWLWQLKEYHFGRFRAHFSTHQGKKLIFNLSNRGQLILIAGGLLIIFGSEKYALEGFLIWLVLLEAFFVISVLWVLFKIATRRLRVPVLTKKIILILSLGFLFELYVILVPLFASISGKPFLLHRFLLLLLILYFFSLYISSCLVWLIQPLAVWQRNKILKRAKQKKEKFKNLIVIGITGSYGKTTTKEFLATILSEQFRVLKTKEHINAEIGIAQTILQELQESHEIFIAEIGAYNKGKIKQVCQMLQPKIGVLTGINEQHLATFGSQENIIKAKYELIESLPQDGLAIFNGSCKYCRELYQRTSIPQKTTSLPDNTIQAIARNLLPWDIENLLMAKAVAEALGISQEEIGQGIKKIKSPTQIKQGINGLKIIDSTYSANPHSVMAHLEYLKGLGGKKVLVMACLIELGKASKEVHQRIGEKIGKVCDLAIIITKDQFKELKQAARKSGMSEGNILFIKKPKEILEKIKTFTQPNDIILLESRMPQRLIDELTSNKI